MRPPDYTGEFTRAWVINKDAHANAAINPISYLIKAPKQHIIWDYYLLSLINLSGPAQDGSYASKDFSDAKWEIGVFALNPDYIPDPDKFVPIALLPQNVRVQLPAYSEEQMLSLMDILLQAVLRETLALEPPGSPKHFWRYWSRIIEATLEHPYHEH